MFTTKKASLPISPLVLNYYVAKVQFNLILKRASDVGFRSTAVGLPYLL